MELDGIIELPAPPPITISPLTSPLKRSRSDSDIEQNSPSKTIPDVKKIKIENTDPNLSPAELKAKRKVEKEQKVKETMIGEVNAKIPV
jgi:hypothetical protein